MDSRLKKFLSYYRPYRRVFWADMACAAIVAATTLALPVSASYITKHVLPGLGSGGLYQLYAVGAGLLALVAVHTAANTFVDYQGHMMGSLMERDMRRDLLAHYQKLSFSFYDGQRTGQLMSRVTNDLAAISELAHHGPEDLAIAALKLAGVLVVLLSLNAQLSALLLLLLPVMAVYAFYFHQRMNAALLASRERIGDLNAQVEDTLAGIRVVASFTNEAIEQQKFAAANAEFVASRRAGYRSEAYYYGGMGAFMQLLTIGVIVLGGAAIATGTLALADLLTYLLCVGILIEPIQRLVNFARVYQEGLTGFTRFMEILELEPEIQDVPGAQPLTGVRGRIEFRGVSFRYQAGQAWVLKDLSLDIQAGEYVALVGSSGVGKTTLCSLIPRFYDVSAGEICLDGQNIQSVTLRSLRRHIGLVQQDVYLFAGTVADNLRYGRPDATPADLIQAAQRANAHDFIRALPQGYDTDIGQRGVRLSGGQKQRLSIARAFLKDPPILILDEATSALDNENERAVQASLADLARDRTTLVIAHRLSTIRHAHRIVVLGEHGIDEQGSHAELLARGGAYAAIYHLQFA